MRLGHAARERDNASKGRSRARRNWRLVQAAEPATVLQDERLVQLVAQVSERMQVPATAILSRLRHRAVVAARHEVWRAAVREMGMSQSHVARGFNLHASTVAAAVPLKGL